jgi:hypothetical protein
MFLCTGGLFEPVTALQAFGLMAFSFVCGAIAAALYDVAYVIRRKH